MDGIVNVCLERLFNNFMALLMILFLFSELLFGVFCKALIAIVRTLQLKSPPRQPTASFRVTLY